MENQQISRFDSRRLIDNREMRIFLSSTFSDMQQERNALLRTFDSLKIEANRRNVTLSVLDLRWGVTYEEARSGKVLSVCLEEIEHSHPFFIGLLGSRYGTAPDISEIEKNPELEERYPWIRDDIDHELSITEMEMQYGALRNDKEVEALFLIKNTPDTLPDDNDRLTQLKNKILDQDRFAKTDYTSIDDLCQKVEMAILDILDKHFPKEGYSRLGFERTIQKAYINSRHGLYQKPIADFKRLDNFLDGDETHLVITGPSGIGKSALIANWLKEKEGVQLSHKIIYHFVGNSFGGSDHRQVLQHICDELYNLYGIKRHEGLNETLEDEAQRILIEAGQKGKPVLIVIDGINQIDDQDHSKLLNWLPQAPNNAKYLFSTLEGDETMETIKRRDYPIHQIGTLDRASRREFVVNYLHNVGKKLTDEQMDRILDDPENENMLVLKTLLDELICFGIHEKLDSRIDYYLSAESIDDFFDRMLQRMEEDYEKVPQILSLIALSENGLTEDDLQAITRQRPLDIHLFYCAFYNHFVTRDGLITFGHQYVTDAVWRRYGLEDQEKARPYRQQIIDHISIDQSISRNRKTSELAFQYYHTSHDEKLYKTILSFEAFRYFNASDQGKATLALYWRKLLEKSPEKYHLRNYLDLPFEGISLNRLPYLEIGQFINTYFGDHKTAFMYSQTFLFMSADNGEQDSLTMADAYNDNGTVYKDMGQYSKALEYHFKALEIRENILGPDHRLTGTSHNEIGMVLQHMGEYSKALEHHLKSLKINEKVLGFDHPSTASSYNNIGMIYDSLGDYSKALEHHFKALSIYEKTLGLEHPLTATSHNNIGMAYNHQGKYTKALEHHFKALEIREKVLGPEHPSTAVTYNNISGVYSEQGNYPNALEYYHKVLTICEKTLGLEHPFTATSYSNIGTAYDGQGNYSKALEYNFKALEIREKVLGPEHPSTATSYNNIGYIYYKQGVYPEALEFLFKALEIREKVLGHDHPDTASSYNNIGTIYDKQGDNPKALEYYYKALSIFEKTLGPEHPLTATSHNNIGMVYYDQGNYSEALEFLFKALEIREKALGHDHPDTANSYNDIGSIYYYQKDYPKALEYYYKTLSIFEKTLGPEHPLTASSHNNIGMVYDDQRDYPKALEHYFKALEIREKALGHDHPDTANSYNDIGSIYYYQKDYPKAIECYYKALTIFEKTLGPEHPNIAASYGNIGMAYDGQENYSEALKYHFKALQIEEKVLGADHPSTAITHNNIGQAYEGLGDYSKALEYYYKALEILEKELDPDHPYITMARENIDYAQNKLSGGK